LVGEGEVGMVLDQLLADCQMETGTDSFSQNDLLAKTMAKDFR